MWTIGMVGSQVMACVPTRPALGMRAVRDGAICKNADAGHSLNAARAKIACGSAKDDGAVLHAYLNPSCAS